jgi:L-aspartate semialdehyde sulfurtransferase
MSQKRGAETLRTYDEINAKIIKGEAIVFTADEFIDYVNTKGMKMAAKEVDVVTTGTFGAMCSSGAFLNFGHSEPPIKMIKCWLNDVPAYKGLAAVDAYLGATAISETRGIEYGGGHVIEDLVNHKDVALRGEGYGTDCYPRKNIETTVNLESINQAILLNPRNAYEHYNAATNSSDSIIHTYMGTLLPRHGNVTYSGAGQLSPLYKDLNYETLGIGTRIFLGGGVGYAVGEGTQHSPQSQFGTLMVRGDLKKMKGHFLRGSTFHGYGSSLYVGLGVPIPIINERVAESAAIPDGKIYTNILDYSVPSRNRPSVKRVTYAELKTGRIDLNGKTSQTSPLSSFKYAKEIALTLKEWISRGEFLLNRPAELLPAYSEVRPLEAKEPEPRVRDIMIRKVITARPYDEVKSVAAVLVKYGVDHLPITDDKSILTGIVTSWDLAKALAEDKTKLSEIMTTKVVTALETEPVDVLARRLNQHNISGAPVVDGEGHVVGIVTAKDLSKLLRR